MLFNNLDVEFSVTTVVALCGPKYSVIKYLCFEISDIKSSFSGIDASREEKMKKRKIIEIEESSFMPKNV